MREKLENYPNQQMEGPSFGAKANRAVVAGLMVAGSVVGLANRIGASEQAHRSTLTALETAHDAGSMPSNVTLVVEKSSVKASDVVTGKITFLADEHIKGYKDVKSSSCLTETTFWNSGRAADGKIFFFKDHNGKICRDANSPTGWVKVSGGETGRDCGNIAKPFGSAPGPVAPGKVEILANLNVEAKLEAKATASATAHCESPGGSASASASASSIATDRINLQAFSNETATQEDRAVISLAGEANFKAQASAEASAQAECTTTTVETTIPPTTPPTTPPITTIPAPTFEPVKTEIVNQGMEPVDENSQVVICETVSGGDSGDALAVNANVVNEANGQAAGSISSPAYNSATGYWCEIWSAPNFTTTDARINVNVVDSTEQSQGAPAGDYLASTNIDVAVMQTQ